MSAARPARCLLSRRLVAAVKPAAPSRRAPFHSAAPRPAPRRPRFKNIKAAELGLVGPREVDNFTQEKFPSYTPEELEVLGRKYSPEQMEALQAGEAAIDPRDLTIQGRIRTDPYRPPYLDDFSRILPVVDNQPKLHPPPSHPDSQWMDDDDIIADMVKFVGELMPEGVDWAKLPPNERKDLLLKNTNLNVAVTKYFEDRSAFTDGNEPTNSALAPSLGKNPRDDAGLLRKPVDTEDEGLDDEGLYQEMKQQTNLSVREIISMKFLKVLVERRVSNQTRLGKIISFSVMAMAGNGNGRLGIGEAKSVQPAAAVHQAKMRAIRNMQPIRRYEDRTIYGTVVSKFGATIVRMDASPPGFGLRAPHRLFEMFRAAGITDIAARMPRGRNPMNSVKACFHALTNQPDPEAIALGRGRKLVDVRKVYYGGNTY